MKYFIGILSFLLFTACQNNSTIEHSKFKTIMLKSSGEVEVLPDQASFSIDLECLDKSIKKSKNCLIEKSNKLNEQLQSLGVNKNDILTTNINLRKSYKWWNNSRIFEGYKSSTSLIVTVKDMDILDGIYTQILDNKNLSIYGLNFTHSNMDSLKNDAYMKALEKSDSLADKLLDKLPESKKEILKIGNVEISASTPNAQANYKENYMSDAREIREESASFEINKGTIKVNATLFIEYQIQ